MRKPSFFKVIVVLLLVNISCITNAQPPKPIPSSTSNESSAKPFKVLTNGRQITISSKENLKSLLVWTSSGHRIVEQKEMNSTSHSFNVPLKENIVFMLIEMGNGKRFTEKLGVK